MVALQVRKAGEPLLGFVPSPLCRSVPSQGRLAEAGVRTCLWILQLMFFAARGSTLNVHKFFSSGGSFLFCSFLLPLHRQARVGRNVVIFSTTLPQACSCRHLRAGQRCALSPIESKRTHSDQPH